MHGTSPRPKDTRARAQVLQTLQVSLLGGTRSTYRNLPQSSFLSSFSEVPRFLRRGVASVVLVLRARADRASRRGARSRVVLFPVRFARSLRNRPRRVARRGVTRASRLGPTRRRGDREAASKRDARKRAPASRGRFSRRETASLARSLARSSEGRARAGPWTTRLQHRDARRSALGARRGATVPVSSTNSYP